jgi:hypothetical protein
VGESAGTLSEVSIRPDAVPQQQELFINLIAFARAAAAPHLVECNSMENVTLPPPHSMSNYSFFYFLTNQYFLQVLTKTNK